MLVFASNIIHWCLKTTSPVQDKYLRYRIHFYLKNFLAKLAVALFYEEISEKQFTFSSYLAYKYRTNLYLKCFNAART